MTSEPYTWERRQFRKHGGVRFGNNRWRERSYPRQHHHHYNNPNRSFLGHDSRQIIPDEFGHGLMTFRPNENMLEDESRRPSGSGRYGKYRQEYRGTFVQKDYRAHPSTVASQPNGSGKHNCTSGQSSGRKLEREYSLNSVNWKPLKWTRSESSSVRNSGFIHSSSSRILETDSNDMKMDLLQKNEISVPSPPREASADFAVETSNAAGEETNSRKKQSLGWGLGLAKFENKKVDSSDESEKKGANICGRHLEPLRSHASDFTSKSPELVMVSECALPATPSVACSSSPCLQEKHVIETVSADQDSAYICKSSSKTRDNSNRSFNLEELDLSTVSNVNFFIEELLQSDDPTIDSSFLRSTAMNKLSMLKNDISKAVETTETEIDLLENELKMIISQLRSNDNHLHSSSSVPIGCLSKPYEDHSAASNGVLKPSGLHVVVDSEIPSEDDHQVVNDLDVGNSGSATSKFVEVSLSKDISPPEISREMELIGDPDLNMSNIETEREMDHLIEEKPISLSSDGVGPQLVGCSSFSSEASFVQNGLVKERFLRRKYCFKLKEKILALKSRIFWHLWKENKHTLSLKKLRGKIRKKSGLSLRNEHSSCQKQRRSILSQCSSTAGLSLIATTELLSCASRFLAETQIKPLRSAMKMPSMIINWHERMTPRFISYNGLVEDPLAIEKERSINNRWSPEDEELFIDKLTVFGKDFMKIASFLDHKTIADCVEFYYKNHKSDTFKRAKKKPESSKQSNMTYLRTSATRGNLEANAASLKSLGAASAVSAKFDDCMEIQPKHASKSFLVPGSCKMESGGDNEEIEAVAADVLAGICSLSSEAMSSCITSSPGPGEGYHNQKYERVGSSKRSPLTPDVTQNVVETSSGESCGDMYPTDWTDEEKTLLIQAVSSYGKDFTMISRCVKTKTQDQCKIFFSKARKCLGFDKTCPRSENVMKDDTNKGGSDACFLETGSVMSNGKSGLRIDEDIASGDMKLGHVAMKVPIDSVKSDLNGAQEIVIGDMDSTYTLTSNNLLPDVHGKEDIFKLSLVENDGNRNSGEVVSNSDVAHDVGQVNVENLPNLAETVDNAELVCNGSHVNGCNTEVIPDLGVADDVGRVNTKSMPKVSESGTRSRKINASCIVVPEAKPDIEACICESKLTANDIETKETTMRCSLHDEHPGGHLAGNKLVQQARESGVEEKRLVLQHQGSALADQESTISRIQHGNHLYDNASIVPEKMSDVQYDKVDLQHRPKISLMEQMQSTCKVEQYPRPAAISTIKEDVSSDIICTNLVPEGTNVARYSGRDFHLQSCHSRKAVSSDAELASAPREGDPPEPSSGSQPYINKLSTDGDVKLFGQILSKTSLHKQHLSFGGESSIMCLDDPRLRKIGYQDQDRIPKGSSTLPDSTILLARYPTTFSNYVPQQSVGCSLNGVPTFSNKDVGVNNGSADLPVYQNQEMQSFSLDMKNRHGHLLAQAQKRNGFDLVLVGVSDPVLPKI